jgi:PilZ domain
MPSSSRRSLYRVAYPLAERPTFRVGRYAYAVVDCSERGIRYEVANRRLPSLGTPLGGVLEFRREGASVEISGEVIRTRGMIVALALDAPGIPFSHILAEQRYLRARGFLSEPLTEASD